ncbi:hypothetical protein [Streptomyces acidicola]|uniref:hypothetical protein n=1 Tax=Streptomyces acidicola TaxID=2596892 RepID=UPI00382C905F
MTRMTKYMTAAAIVAALAGAPTMAQALTPANATHATSAKAGAATSVKSSNTSNTSKSSKMSKPESSVRVVAPGERVQAAPNVELWLTEEGKHWSTPNQADQFRSVVDGNIDMSRPGVSLQMEPVDGRYFLSGVYHGEGDAASVKVVTDKGTITGRVVYLAGRPGWGAWYATSPLPDESKSADKPKSAGSFVRSVTVLDTAGRTMATLTLS